MRDDFRYDYVISYNPRQVLEGVAVFYFSGCWFKICMHWASVCLFQLGVSKLGLFFSALSSIEDKIVIVIFPCCLLVLSSGVHNQISHSLSFVPWWTSYVPNLGVGVSR